MEEAIVQAVNFVAGLLHIAPAMLTAIFVMLFGISEFLGGFSKIKQNAVYQVVSAIIKKLAGK